MSSNFINFFNICISTSKIEVKQINKIKGSF